MRDAKEVALHSQTLVTTGMGELASSVSLACYGQRYVMTFCDRVK
jgi:hypothetical protein